VLGLTSYLQHNGHRSVVATDPRGALYARLTQAELPTYPLKVRNHLDFSAGLSLRHMANTGSYDVIHFHTARAHALSPWLSGLPVKRIVTRRMDYAIKPGKVTRLLYERSVDAVVAISDGVRAALQAGGVPLRHIRVIPSGIDTARFMQSSHLRNQVRAAHEIRSDEDVVLMVGALSERKGHSTLLHAAHHLQERGIRLRYLVCGDGPLRTTLETEARQLGLTENLQFLGFCPDVLGYLAAADIFVHVPLWEGLGVAVIEALAAGLPVIASRVGGLPELIDGHTTGVLVPPQDAVALAIALERVIQNRPWAKTLAQAGQTLVRTRFDVTVMAQANEALYYQLLAGTR